jgi:hypothetical protein
MTFSDIKHELMSALKESGHQGAIPIVDAFLHNYVKEVGYQRTNSDYELAHRQHHGKEEEYAKLDELQVVAQLAEALKEHVTVVRCDRRVAASIFILKF